MNTPFQNILVAIAIVIAFWILVRHFFPKKEAKKGCGSSGKDCGC